MATYLCLDDATKITGYSVFTDSKLKHYGVVSSEIKENKPFKRMKIMVDKIKGLIKKYKPDYVAIENCQFQHNYETYKQLSQLQGMLILTFIEIGIPYVIVSPTTWKSFCKIKGRKREEQKTNTVKMIEDKFHLTVTEDEADSIGIGLYAVNYIKNGGILNEKYD